MIWYCMEIVLTTKIVGFVSLPSLRFSVHKLIATMALVAEIVL